MSSSSKKLIASYGALCILIFHCWIPVLPYGTILGSAERFLLASTFVGVDLFFFISAYSLVSRPVENYPEFIKNRAIKILPLFFIAWALGHFMWFLPSIMVVYLALPPLYKICRKNPALSLPLILLGWAGCVYLILGILRPSYDVGIFLFRVPAIIAGAYAAGISEKLTTRTKLTLGIILLCVGTALVYKFGYVSRLSVPFRSEFYLTGLPSTLGIALALDELGKKVSPRITDFFGSMTLELYFSQMVLGSLVVGAFFRMTGSKLATNLLSIAAVIAVAAAVKFVYGRILRLTEKRDVKAPSDERF